MQFYLTTANLSYDQNFSGHTNFIPTCNSGVLGTLLKS